MGQIMTNHYRPAVKNNQVAMFVGQTIRRNGRGDPHEAGRVLHKKMFQNGLIHLDLP
jgi:hypothetical protein